VAKNDLTTYIFADYLSDLCARSPLASEYRLFWTIIANPKAGGFNIRARWKKHYNALRASAKKSSADRPDNESGPSKISLVEGDRRGLVLTRKKGHACLVAQALLKEAASFRESHPDMKPLYLIVTAGGDGTSLEVQSALYQAPAELRSCFAVLRLPMGTGNDGADARDLGDALRLINEPSEITYQRTVKLTASTPGKGPWLAFNILSFGLDAFVTHMTNRMKGKLPGDFYKLWVDIAALLYDRLYKVGPLDVRAVDFSGNEVIKISEELLLLAIGESGHRTYGSNKRILPDDRNVCAVKQMPMLRKVALKSAFSSGAHIEKPESILFNAARLEISGIYPILAQMDGESVLLDTADFPVTVELSEPVIPVLRVKKPS